MAAWHSVLADDSSNAGFESAKASYEQGDYANSFPQVLRYAETGVAEAQVIIAGMYLTGESVEKNLHEAFKWYDQAVQHGTSRDFIATAKRSRDAVARLAGIKIPVNIVPMEGSGFLALYEGRLIEYDPVLSDFDVSLEGTVQTEILDGWKGGRPTTRYVSQHRRKPRVTRSRRDTVNDPFDFGTPSHTIGRNRTGKTRSRSSSQSIMIPVSEGNGYDTDTYSTFGQSSTGSIVINRATGQPMLHIGTNVFLNLHTGKIGVVVGQAIPADN